MDKLKKKIIKYFVICAFLVSVTESVVDSTFTDCVLPQFTDSRPAFLFMLMLFLFFTFTVFVLWALLFWKLTSRAVNEESTRQVNERNMQYSRICHDLKTPMTSVQGFATALRDGKIKSEEQQEILNIIYEKSCYMNELIESMFAYSKLGTDNFQLSRKRMDLGSLVRAIVALHYDEFEKREMELRLDIPEEPLLCLVDEKEMKRSIGNLLVNAYKHNPGGAEIMVWVSCNESTAFVVVADNGIAIPAEQECCIFEPFMCGDEARPGGNGLGLTISRMIIRKHGGDLYIRKNINGYTKGFVVQIPLAD